MGTLTKWNEREMELDLSVPGEENFKAEVFKNGPNADKKASDYEQETIKVPQDRKLKFSMAPGGD